MILGKNDIQQRDSNCDRWRVRYVQPQCRIIHRAEAGDAMWIKGLVIKQNLM